MAFEFRGKEDSETWRRTWDACLVVGSFLPALLLGVAARGHVATLKWRGVPSAPPRCLDGGDVDLLHRHHRLEGTLCLTATSRKRLG